MRATAMAVVCALALALVVGVWCGGLTHTHASPLAMWVAGDLPTMAEVTAEADAQLQPQPQPLPPPIGASHRPRGAATGAAAGPKALKAAAAAAVAGAKASERKGCSVSFDNSVYEFGGADRTHGALTADLQRFDQMMRTWELVRGSRVSSSNGGNGNGDGTIPASAAAPAPRYGHACAVSGQNLLMFGGFGEADEAFQDIWQFNFLDKTWKELRSAAAPAAATSAAPRPPPTAPSVAPVAATAPSAGPCGRIGHSAVVDNSRRALWVFGGRDTRGRLLRDLHAYDLHSGEWTAYLPADSVIADAAAVYPRTDDRVASSGVTDVAQWPGARELHACVVDRDDTMWCYGGVGYAADVQYVGALSDVWTFPLGTLTLPTAAQKGVLARWKYAGGSVHFAVNEAPRYTQPEVVLHRENLVSRVQDARYYRFRQRVQQPQQRASLIEASASAAAAAAAKNLPLAPGARYNPLMAYDKDAHQIWMFGGADATNAALNDLWALRLSDRMWTPYHGLTAANTAPVLWQRGVTGPMVWPPAGVPYRSAALSADARQLWVYGSHAGPYPRTAVDPVWALDLYGHEFAHGVDVCSSSPCAHGGVCVRQPDMALGGGVGYRCDCPTGWKGRHCTLGDHLFRHINNPFMGDHTQPPSDLTAWKTPEQVTAPYPLLPTFVPPKVPAAPPLPVTVGPMHIPATETRTVTVVRPPGSPPRQLPVELHPNLASDPRVISEARRTLQRTGAAVDRTRQKIRRISNAPLVERDASGRPINLFPPMQPQPQADGAAAAAAAPDAALDAPIAALSDAAPAPAPVPTPAAGALQPMAAPAPKAPVRA